MKTYICLLAYREELDYTAHISNVEILKKRFLKMSLKKCHCNLATELCPDATSGEIVEI